MKAIRLTAAALLVGIVLSPYLVYANEPQMSTESVFVTYDLDRSGTISRDEFAEFLQTANADIERVHRDFNMMDLNKDGQITLEEMEVGEDIYPLAFR